MDSPLHSSTSAEVTRLLVQAGADLEAREIGISFVYFFLCFVPPLLLLLPFVIDFLSFLYY